MSQTTFRSYAAETEGWVPPQHVALHGWRAGSLRLLTGRCFSRRRQPSGPCRSSPNPDHSPNALPHGPDGVSEPPEMADSPAPAQTAPSGSMQSVARLPPCRVDHLEMSRRGKSTLGSPATLLPSCSASCRIRTADEARPSDSPFNTQNARCANVTQGVQSQLEAVSGHSCVCRISGSGYVVSAEGKRPTHPMVRGLRRYDQRQKRRVSGTAHWELGALKVRRSFGDGNFPKCCGSQAKPNPVGSFILEV